MVWEQLRDQAPADRTLLSNVVLVHDVLEYEIDLLVLIPCAGAVVVEVKGGSVAVDADGQWRQHVAYGQKAIDPSPN